MSHHDFVIRESNGHPLRLCNHCRQCKFDFIFRGIIFPPGMVVTLITVTILPSPTTCSWLWFRFMWWLRFRFMCWSRPSCWPWFHSRNMWEILTSRSKTWNRKEKEKMFLQYCENQIKILSKQLKKMSEDKHIPGSDFFWQWRNFYLHLQRQVQRGRFQILNLLNGISPLELVVLEICIILFLRKTSITTIKINPCKLVLQKRFWNFKSSKIIHYTAFSFLMLIPMDYASNIIQSILI